MFNDKLFTNGQVILAFNFIIYEKLLYGGWYEYPGWGYAIGWILSTMSLVWIPAYAVYYSFKKMREAPEYYSIQQARYILNTFIYKYIYI